ncbi:MAG TPA: zinc-binding dehydrogenase [Solirubrobacteraceae bacterium]
MIAATIESGEVAPREHPDPCPGHGEVLVRVRAAGLNGADIIQRAGHYPAPPGSPPDIPGLELAGEVAELGPGATRFAPGARVMAIVGGGGQAELALVNERQLMAVPERLDWPSAGGVPEAFTTAHDALFTQCGLLAGERLLVHGAAGGVGTAAIGLALAAGARVHASVRNEALRDRVAGLGANVIAPENFAEQGPFDVILELVGAVNLPQNLQALAPEGRIAVIGIGAGSKGELDLRQLMAKRARIHGSMLRARTLEDKAQTARRMERSVLPLLAEGAVSVPVAATFPLARVADAYEAFTAGGKFGKIVLTMD